MSAAALMLLAWIIEIAIGWPDRWYRRIGHPVSWLGSGIALQERLLNRPHWTWRARCAGGVLTTLSSIGLATGLALAVSVALPGSGWGVLVEAAIASSLLASRSLHVHVARVARPLARGDLAAACAAVSMIVGRDPARLDDAGVARAGLESLAENASDGVVAPLMWGVAFGLPGLAAYKAVNTLDSMIGHRDEAHAAFGAFAARLDDLVNLIPARATGLLLAVASLRRQAFTVMLRDARQHRSPNAGWPEAAMAGALGVRLSGPRAYVTGMQQEPWLFAEARDPTGTDLTRGLTLYVRALSLGALLLLGLAVWMALGPAA